MRFGSLSSVCKKPEVQKVERKKHVDRVGEESSQQNEKQHESLAFSPEIQQSSLSNKTRSCPRGAIIARPPLRAQPDERVANGGA